MSIVEKNDALANELESNGANRYLRIGREHGCYQGGRGQENYFKEKVCMYYGNNDHTIDICYKKYGYPSNRGFARGDRGNVNNLEVERWWRNADEYWR